MHEVSEAAIPGPWPLAGLPRHALLYSPIVTGSAAQRVWPDRLVALDDARVASRAQREHVCVPLVRKSAFRRTCNARCREEPTRCHQRGNDARQELTQFHLLEGLAGGRGARSARDPNEMLAPARSRS